MANIVIVDDDTDQSETVKMALGYAIEDQGSNLEVLAIIPFQNKEDYFDFIIRNEVCVLILDEKLNDKVNDSGMSVGYLGSDLVTFLRTKLKEFPIFSITNFSEVDELKEKYKEYEDIINRKDFLNQTEMYFPKIWRAAKNFLNENEDELSQFNELTKLIASGNDDPQLIKKIQAIQTKLELPFSGYSERGIWLQEYENQLKSLEDLNALIKSKLEQ